MSYDVYGECKKIIEALKAEGLHRQATELYDYFTAGATTSSEIIENILTCIDKLDLSSASEILRKRIDLFKKKTLDLFLHPRP